MTGIALILVLATGVWGMMRDLGQVTESITRAKLAKFQSHVERTVHRIESEINQSKDLHAFVSSNHRWFENIWELTVRRMPEALYGAVLDAEHQPMEDSNRLLSREHEQTVGSSLIKLPSQTGGLSVGHLGDNLLLLPSSSQTAYKRVLDVTYPIRIGTLVLGYHRTGMDYDLLQAKIVQARRGVLGGWVSILMAITAIVAGACVSLYRLGLHTVQLEQQLGTAESRRVDELHRLIVGLAHEIRNPLNAIRLNLFASKKMLSEGRAFDIEEAAIILDESVEEIERMDDLVGQLLGYARVVAKPPSLVNLNEQIGSVLKFLRQALEQRGVQVSFTSDQVDHTVSIDPQSLRQILINLLQNACQSMESGGAIKICVEPADKQVQISVHDSGPGVDESIMQKIFDPFFSTREDGVGMGLAVVKGLVESSKGRISCRRSELLCGMEFRIELPHAALESVG